LSIGNALLNPTLVGAVCVSLYWLIVVLKVIFITPSLGKTPNIVPKEIVGGLSRVIMLPLIMGWVVLIWQVYLYSVVSMALFAWIGAIGCVVALGLTIYCWYYMGGAWRIGIDPKEKNPLVTGGPFKYSRHPIYALSMLLMLSSFLAAQTKGMFVLLCIHWALFFWEALREERHLLKMHGETYRSYMQQTNRFFPGSLCVGE